MGFKNNHSEFMVREGRCAPPVTFVPDWVILSGVSPQAICLFAVMCMYDERGAPFDLDVLAKTMKVRDARDLAPWITELIGVDAVSVSRESDDDVYTLYQTPPPGYEGRVSLRLPYEPPLPRPAGPDPGPVVYYLGRADGAIKIGHSAQLRKRVASLETEHGPLDLMCTEPGGWDLEQHRHREFASARISMTAEWFKPDDDLLRHIGALNGCVRVMA